MKKNLYIMINLLAYSLSLNAIDSDFGRRFGANSHLYQRPLYYKDGMAQAPVYPKDISKERLGTKCERATCKCANCSCKNCAC